MNERYENDLQFEEARIKSVSREGSDGWTVKREDGWSFYIPASHGVEPKPGMLARFYGKGTGFTVRGLLLDGQHVFYRTEEENRNYREVEMYGADADEWLVRWDSGRTCWTIEMGGMGPGYEQCIHVACAEMLRHMLATKYRGTAWADLDLWERDRKLIDRAISDNKVVSRLDLSGAQYDAALNLAVQFYRRGPRDVMTDPAVKDRHIQVSKNFPKAEL